MVTGTNITVDGGATAIKVYYRLSPERIKLACEAVG